MVIRKVLKAGRRAVVLTVSLLAACGAESSDKATGSSGTGGTGGTAGNASGGAANGGGAGSGAHSGTGGGGGTSGGGTGGSGVGGGGAGGGGGGPVSSVGDCSSETGLSGRQDIVFCEPWEKPDWWQHGWLKVASTTKPKVAEAAHVGNASIINKGCISGSCLRVEMKQYQSGAIAIHWPLKEAGLAPESAYLRYYLKLAPNFDPALCDSQGGGQGSGGKFPGFSDVRVWPEPQCGNGGAFADGINCWSMRALFRNCYKACDTKPAATTRFGSYPYLSGQKTFEAGIWDNDDWGQGTYSQPFGGCSTPEDVGGCGIGDGGVLENDKWYRMETQITMNTPGVADGIHRGWVDGVLSYEKKNVIYRMPGHDNLHVRTVWLNVHAGGESVGLCQASAVTLDQLVVALDQPVGK